MQEVNDNKDDTAIASSSAIATAIASDPATAAQDDNQHQDQDQEDLCAICYHPFQKEGEVEKDNPNDNNNNNNNNSSTVIHAILPCCERESSSTKFCFRCIELLCQNASYGDNVGRCPRCRAFLQVVHDTDTNTTHNTIQVVPEPPAPYNCVVCHQQFTRNNIHALVNANQNNPNANANNANANNANANLALCKACHLGLRNPLRYECQSCGGIQAIAHPMYRYQHTPQEFSNNTWACHHPQCQTYTNWRVVPNDLHRVPIEDIPESWNIGQEHAERELEEAIAAVRQIRQQEFQNGHRGAGAGAGAGAVLAKRRMDWNTLVVLGGVIAFIVHVIRSYIEQN